MINFPPIHAFFTRKKNSSLNFSPKISFSPCLKLLEKYLFLFHNFIFVHIHREARTFIAFNLFKLMGIVYSPHSHSIITSFFLSLYYNSWWWWCFCCPSHSHSYRNENASHFFHSLFTINNFFCIMRFTGLIILIVKVREKFLCLMPESIF